VTAIIDLTDVTRTYGSGPTATAAPRGVSLTVGEGELVALRGRSGSGKTTLLNIVGGLDRPDSEGVTALVATHDPALMEIADSVLYLADGTIATAS
jgi:putative ABC transport system ATP-binding protein